MDNSLIPKSIAKSIEEMFKVMLQSTASIVDTSAYSKGSEFENVDIVSVLGLVSSTFGGFISLGFKESVYLKAVEKMTGDKFESISRENSDACAEMLNIIYASARAKINEEGGFDFQPAIPTTMLGKGIVLTFKDTDKALQIHCTSDLGDFYILLGMQRKK